MSGTVVGLVLDGGALALLLGIFLRLGQLGGRIQGIEGRLSALETWRTQAHNLAHNLGHGG